MQDHEILILIEFLLFLINLWLIHLNSLCNLTAFAGGYFRLHPVLHGQTELQYFSFLSRGLFLPTFFAPPQLWHQTSLNRRLHHPERCCVLTLFRLGEVFRGCRGPVENVFYLLWKFWLLGLYYHFSCWESFAAPCLNRNFMRKSYPRLLLCL